MKTIEQRLQSRISRRRNFIRFMEDDVTDTKSRRHAIRLLDLDWTGAVLTGLSQKVNESKHMLKELADDQKLDKALRNVLTGRAQARSSRGLKTR